MSKTNPILLAVWLVIAAFTGYLVTDVVNSRQSTEQRVRGEALSYARLVEQHASAAFDRANIALIGISDHVRPSDLTGAGPLPDARRKEIEELLLTHQQRTAGVIATFLTRADGRIAAISLRSPLGTDLSDRENFQTLKRERRAGPLVSEVVYGRASHTWGQMVVRRVDLPDGSFGGMVGANLGLTENFSDFYSTLSLGNNSTVLLRDSENRLLVRYPIAEDKLGKQLSPGGPINERIGAGDTEGAVMTKSTIDNRERVFSVGQRLPADREIALYRIAQEALVNCAKHSRARTVAIRLDQDLERVELTIKDDGAGFHAAEPRAPGLGLLSMQERAQAIGGCCRIESAPGEGTRVIVELTLP